MTRSELLPNRHHRDILRSPKQKARVLFSSKSAEHPVLFKFSSASGAEPTFDSESYGINPVLFKFSSEHQVEHQVSEHQVGV